MLCKWGAILSICALGLVASGTAPAFAGPTTCPDNAVCIDESVEGAVPTVSSASPLFVDATVFDLRFPELEAFGLTITMQGDFIDIGPQPNFILTELETGAISDVLLTNQGGGIGQT